MRSIREILRVLESQAPSSCAESWDNVGLLAGDPDWKTNGAMISIDLTEQAIRVAQAKGYRLIINHHPCIFPRSKGLARVTSSPGSKAGFVFEAIRQGIAVAACHTNFDRCALEVVESVSSGLGLVPRGRLIEKPAESLVKLAVFVPLSHVEAVRHALGAAGAGHIGNYDSCSFGVVGEGTFRGSTDTRPFLGKPGRLERARETRLETIIPRGMENTVLQAMRQAHPYEEIAYDLYPVEQVPPSLGLVKGLGYGFWGEFPKPRPFSEVLQNARRLFKVDGFLLTEPALRRAKNRSQRVAFAAGKGASVVQAAASLGCDLMITGEAGYHEALGGSQAGLAVVELGHRESELFFVPTVKKWLSRAGVKAIGLEVRTQRFAC